MKTQAHRTQAHRIERLEAQRAELLAALERLTLAAQRRDNTTGDPCRLIEVRAELASAADYAQAIATIVRGAA